MITDEQRKAFEQWYMVQFGDKDMQTTESGNYFYVRHAAAWKSWQAAQQVKELDFTDATVEGWAIGGWAKSKCYRAKSSIGTYNVYDVEGQNGRYCFYSFDYESSDNYQTLDEAIEAANADYRKRVLSCLVNGGV